MAYANDVIARMASNLWFQIGSQSPAVINTISGVSAIRQPPVLFGKPEHIPELTYIAQEGNNPNGFIQSAINYHRTYGLVPSRHSAATPVTFSSLQNLLLILQRNSSHIGRLRIVAHAGLSANSDSNMNVPFFEGGFVGITKDELFSFAASDEAGLRALLAEPNPISPSSPLLGDVTPVILGFLRGSVANLALLSPFNLTSADPSGLIQEYFFNLSDLLVSSLMFAHATTGRITAQTNAATYVEFNATQKSNFTKALNIIAERVESKVIASSAITHAQLIALRNAVLAITMTEIRALTPDTWSDFDDLPFTLSHTNTNGVTRYLDPIRNAGAAVAAINNANVRQHINTVRSRFNEHSWIDLRGCRIGQDPQFLEALGALFGNQDHRPAVSGPAWYQSFPSAGHVPFRNESNIDTLWGTGNNAFAQAHTSQHVQDTFEIVQDLLGLDSHMDFWQQVSNFSIFEFIALAWKGDLPTLPMIAPRLENFSGLTFSDTIARIREIFNLTPSISRTSLTRISNDHARILALQIEIQTVQQFHRQAPTTAQELLHSFQRLQAISQQIPNQPITIVPATPPSNLSPAQLLVFATHLKKYYEWVVILDGPIELFTSFLELERSPTNTRLQAILAILGNVEAAIVATTGVNTGENPIVTTGANAAFTQTTLQGYVIPLAAHLTNNAESTAFKKALYDKARISPSTDTSAVGNERVDFRYYFFIGLPLLVATLGTASFYVLNAHRNSGIRSFMRAHWQEPIPAPNQVAASTISQARSTALSVLTETESTPDLSPSAAPGATITRDINDFVNPYLEFNNHIITRP